ncbi:MAG: hypothetical protein ACLFRT_14455 [Actinomycetota bacterium]
MSELEAASAAFSDTCPRPVHMALTRGANATVLSEVSTWSAMPQSRMVWDPEETGRLPTAVAESAPRLQVL